MSEYWKQVEELLDQAMRLKPHQRHSFVENVSDPAVRAEVKSLLAADENAANLPVDNQIREGILEAALQFSISGRILGPYQVLERLAAGGMSEIYIGHDPRLARKVALKLLPRGFSSGHDRVLRFEREARAASALNHPNIVTIYEIGNAADGQLYIAMELVAGEPLTASIARAPLALRDVLSISGQIASALQAAHQARIVHRDIKPSNIVLRPDGIIKVLDFGLARGTPALSAGDDSRTIPGLILGTPGYMSPEQARGQDVDERTDLWSLGAVMYELLTQTRAFDGKNTMDMLVAVVEKEPAPLSDLRPDIPDRLKRLVHKLLTKDAGLREISAADVLEELKAVREDLEVMRPPRRIKHEVLKVVLLALVLLAAFTYWWLTHGSTHTFRYSISAETRAATGLTRTLEVGEGEALPASSRFRFNINAPVPGYVYVVGEQASAQGNQYTGLFPLPSINSGSAQMKANDTLETGWYRFGPTPGVEQLWLIWSGQPVPQLETLRKYLNPQSRGSVTDAGDRSAIEQLLNRKDLRTNNPATGADHIVKGPSEILITPVKLAHK